MKKYKLVITTIFIIAALILLVIIYVVCPKNQTEFKKIDDFTEIYSDENLIIEYYVVLNQPKSLENFKYEVNQFLIKHKRNKAYTSHTIVLIKEHDFDILDRKNSYLQKPPRILDEIDLLCRITWGINYQGKLIRNIHYYSGQGRYY